MKNNLLKKNFSAWDVNFVKPFRTELVIVVKKIQKKFGNDISISICYSLHQNCQKAYFQKTQKTVRAEQKVGIRTRIVILVMPRTVGWVVLVLLILI